MPSAKLGDILTLKRGYDLPKARRLDGPVPIVSSSGITGFHNEPKVSGPGVVTGRYGTIGEVFFVEGDYWPLNTALYVQDFKNHNPRFVYYYLKDILKGTQSDKAAVPGVNRNDLHARIVNIPPESQHQKIVSILSAYDDLIENNRRRIHLLEESARLLYREWFVYLRFPGHEHVPIHDGVPEGWDTRKIEDFYRTASGGTPSRKRTEFFEGDIPWVKTQELHDKFIFDSEERITNEAIKHSAAKIFPPETVIVAMYGATIGRTAILVTPASTNQACCALLPLHPSANYVHAFLFLRENKFELINLGQGSAQNNISQTVIRRFPMVMPPGRIMSRFVALVEPNIHLIRCLQLQNIKLKNARDLLLPRLMNGEISP